MNRTLMIALMIILLIPAVIAQRIDILTVGGYHEEEVSAESGETWLGLFQVGAEFELLAVAISVENDFDSGESNDRGGKIISVPGHGEPVFLIRGGDLRQGVPIETVFSGFMQIDRDFDETYTLNATNYRLTVESIPGRADIAEAGTANLTDNPKLILTRGKTKQILFAPERCVNCHWQINWAGDLDGDGQLDLFVYLSDHYNVANFKLFLSAEAESGKLVNEVAEFITTGC